MPRLPDKDRRSRAGGTLRGNPLRADRLARQERAGRGAARLTREYKAALRKLFSKADLRRAAAIAERVKREWRAASLKVHGDEGRLAVLKRAARRSFQRLVARALPRYRTWRSLHQTYQKLYGELVAPAAIGGKGPHAVVVWGDILPAPPPGALEVVPPFALGDAQLIDEKHYVTADTSFAGPAAGNLVNNIVFDDDQDTPIIIGVYGLIRPETATSLVSCGGNFTMPRAGRLQVNANIRNFYNKATLSLQDNFGFSDGRIDLTVNLFIDIIRGRDVIHIPITQLSAGLHSDGDDVSRIVTDLDNSMLFQIEGVTDEVIPAGERLQVMVGSEVVISSKLDDMRSHANAVYYWQVRKIFLAVV